MRRSKAVVLVPLLFLGCAGPAARIMSAPLRGQSPQQVAQDRAECESEARQWENTGQSAATGGVVGMILGGILGAAVAAPILLLSPDAGSRVVAAGAAMGAAIGGAQGAASAAEGDVDRVNRAYAVCLEARGYVVR